MRLIVTKPKEGQVDIRLEDRQGLTGLLLEEKGVKIADVEAKTAPMVEQWEKRRKAIKDAKKAPLP